ncbi:MAG: exonuclease domain-containing protein, partial [Cyclobacteriaceae bacterium]
MTLNLKIPLCVFDLETTGTNVTQDRILELAFIKLMPSGEEVRKHYLVNPERPIP